MNAALNKPEVGQSFTTDTITIHTEQIIEFAKQFDPQPYHLDERAAADSLFGGLCASGWQVCALMMRLYADTMNARGIKVARSTGVEFLRWSSPVFAEDTLRADIEITSITPSVSVGGHDQMQCAIEVHNQRGERVIKLSTSVLIDQRSALASDPCDS